MSLPRQTLDYALALLLVAAILGVSEVSGESSTRIHPYLRAPAGHGAATCRAARQQVEERRRAPARWTITESRRRSAADDAARRRDPARSLVLPEIARPTLVAPCPYVGHCCTLAFALLSVSKTSAVASRSRAIAFDLANLSRYFASNCTAALRTRRASDDSREQRKFPRACSRIPWNGNKGKGNENNRLSRLTGRYVRR